MKLSALLLAVIPAIVLSQETCRNGRIFEPCGTACPLTCDNHLNPPIFCTQQCVSGCFCPPGLVELNNRCVAPSDCHSGATTTTTAPSVRPTTIVPPTPACSNNMIYQTCGTACPVTCENRNDPPRPCPLICVQGCFCPSGLIELGNRCVAPENCPASATTVPPTPACTNGMVYETCGTACPTTCENRNDPPRPCPAVCVQGCFCPRGTVKSGGSCYAPDACPTTTAATPPTPTTPTCPSGMSYNRCGTACPLTCAQPYFRPCPRICAQGCFCPNGLLQDGNRCVAREDCPPTPATTIAPPTTLPTTTNPVCTNGMYYTTCGSACPLTCQNINRPPEPCPFICVRGCFCPYGMAEYGGSCYEPDQCPFTGITTTVAPPTPPTTLVPTLPTCPSSTMVFTTCGSRCHATCENYLRPFACTLECYVGCICPPNTVLHGGECIQPRNCPGTTAATTTAAATTAVVPTCPSGMEYRECGPICRPTCGIGLNGCFSLRCAPGCFCPEGQYEREGGCVEECGTTPTRPPPTLDPCAAVRCLPEYYCHNGKCIGRSTSTQPPTLITTTGRPTRPPVTFDPLCAVVDCLPEYYCRRGRCISRSTSATGRPTRPTGRPTHPTGRPTRPPVTSDPLCAAVDCLPEYHCRRGRCLLRPTPADPCALVDCLPHQYCQNGRCINYTCATYGCRADQECSMVAVGCDGVSRECYRRPECRDAQYVPCGRDAFLACDSEWTYCLQQNKTRRAQCVSSCLSQNGNCGDDVCITNRDASLQCVNRNDISGQCAPGMVMNSCGNLCQLTCEDHILGQPRACPLVCGPPECGCPPGLALYRDRCVDPKLCYVLEHYPPPINPLPRMDPNTVLLSLHGSEQSREEIMHLRPMLLDMLRQALESEGFTGLTLSVHGVHTVNGQTQIVIEVSGAESPVGEETIEHLAETLRGNSAMLSFLVEGVGQIEVEYIENDDSDGGNDGDEEGQELSQTAIIAIAASSAAAGLAVVVVWISIVVCCCVLRGPSGRPPIDSPPAYKDEKSFLYVTPPEKEMVTDHEKNKMLLESLSS